MFNSMRHFAILFIFLLMAGLTFESYAADVFCASDDDGFAMSEFSEASETVSESEAEQFAPVILFARFLKDAAVSSLAQDLGFSSVHGQPLPGVMITLLLGAAFGLIRRKRGARHTLQNEQNAADAMLITARLFRLNILFLNPPETIHTISPGPDLFSLRE